MALLDLFLTCPKSLEGLLAQECEQLGAESVREKVAGVECMATLEVAYRLCLWSRLANRVLMRLGQGSAEDAEELYDTVQSIDWDEHMLTQGSLAVDFSGTNREIRNTHFAAQRVKDAIVDQLKDKTGFRHSVDKESPSMRVNARLNRGELTLSLDLSGSSLHQRGYRLDGAMAPLKENLAAAILIRSGWPELAKQGAPLLDPMCGSGTLLVEGALIAMDQAPGLNRSHFGFFTWKQHDFDLWREIEKEAEARASIGRKRWNGLIYGYDNSNNALSAAQKNIRRAGLDKIVHVSRKELADFVLPTHAGTLEPGLVATNPPYGERISDMPSLIHLYRHLGDRLKEVFAGWQVSVFTGNADLCHKMGMRSHKQYNMFNGALPCKLLLFTVNEQVERSAEELAANKDKPRLSTEELIYDESGWSDGGRMFANRVRKNLKQLKKWRAKNKIQCFRAYDADMPEYAVAVDVYGEHLHVQEYAPPKTIDPRKAERRIMDVIQVLPAVFDIHPSNIHLKQRKRQSGSAQYEKISRKGSMLTVQEGNAKLLVNMDDYLDTGLFLDHRPIRLFLADEAKDQRVLNLFCYTASATVHSAVGGARSTVSVDLSNTYLEWGRKNMRLNGFSGDEHEFIQADCMEWLSQNDRIFDLIFMDPPTFSNSKRMKDVLDIQRDHAKMIRHAMRVLAPGGALIFSNNLRSFKMDESVLERFDVADISKETIPLDFARNQKIHHCFEIRYFD
jgi:23S rRNA (guanine2445-N2)-methyltransferase / 23S rRNA (guanine2069-N7)-methyltransferase